ncbi:WD domain, G-beta repeat [Pycnococcus provasolii]
MPRTKQLMRRKTGGKAPRTMRWVQGAGPGSGTSNGNPGSGTSNGNPGSGTSNGNPGSGAAPHEPEYVVVREPVVVHGTEGGAASSSSPRIVSDNAAVTLVGHTDGVLSARYSTDGKHVVSTSMDKTVRIWNVETRKTEKKYEGHKQWVLDATLSPDGEDCVSLGDGEGLRQWSVGTALQEHQATRTRTRLRLRSVSYSFDGKYLACASWDAKNVCVFHTWKTRGMSRPVASCRQDGYQYNTILSNGYQYILRHNCRVENARFNPVNSNLVVSAGCDNTVRAWDVKECKCKYELIGHSRIVYAATYSPDGNYIASASLDGTVRVWNTRVAFARRDTCVCAPTHVLRGHTSSVNDASWSPDGTRIVSASDDNTLRIWWSATGQCVQILKGHMQFVTSASWSPDGLRVLSGSRDYTVMIWNVGAAAKPTAAVEVDSEDDVLLVEDRSADEVREAKKRKLGVVDLSGSSAGAGAGGTRSVVVIE